MGEQSRDDTCRRRAALGRLDGAIDGLGEVLEPSHDGLTHKARWGRMQAAARVAAGFTHHGCGRQKLSRELAHRALALGNTMGHWIHAAALPPGSLNERISRLGDVEAMRTGDLNVLSDTMGAQTERAARLAEGAWKAVT